MVKWFVCIDISLLWQIEKERERDKERETKTKKEMNKQTHSSFANFIFFSKKICPYEKNCNCKNT